MTEPEPPSAFWPAGHNWASSIRWFTAEFIVVVAGILVALALSGWAADRRDREREQSYLRQLSVDLGASAETLSEATDFMRLRAEASARVLHRFWRDDLTVDASTIEDLSLPQSMRRFNPVLGTATALMSTGDLNLIRDDALRSRIVTYLDVMRTKQDDVRRFDETYYRPGVEMLIRGPDLIQFLSFRPQDETQRIRPNVIERIPFPSSVEEVLRERSVYDGYIFLLTSHRNQSFRYGDMLEETRSLRAMVDAALVQ